MSIIYILWLRQIKRYARSKSRIIGSLGQPILFLVALGFGFGPVFQRAGQGNYLEFLAPGIIAMSILFTAIFNGVEIIWDRQFGFLKETLVAPVSRLQIMFGRTLGGATVAALQGLIVLFISMFVGFRPVSWGILPLVIVGMFLVALLFTAFGTAVASRLEDMHGFQLIMNFLVMPLFFLSGALFPLSGLTGWITVAARANPLTYGVDMLRGMLIDVHLFSLTMDFAVLGILTFVCLVIGSYLFNTVEV